MAAEEDLLGADLPGVITPLAISTLHSGRVLCLLKRRGFPRLACQIPLLVGEEEETQ